MATPSVRGIADREGVLRLQRVHRFYINGEAREVSAGMFRRLAGWNLVPDGCECDGCSGSPDTWRGYKLWPACVIHDRMYDPDALCGANWAGRWQADREFRQNLRTLLEYQRAPWHLRATLPWVYFRAVRLAGAGSYFFADGEEPLSGWQRFRELVGLFRDKRERK